MPSSLSYPDLQKLSIQVFKWFQKLIVILVELNTIIALIFKLSITKALMGFPCGSAGKESACNAGDLSLIPGLGRSPGEENGYPSQYSGLENPMDCIVHGVAKNQTRLSNFHHVHIVSFFLLRSFSKSRPSHPSLLSLLFPSSHLTLMTYVMRTRIIYYI